MAPLRPISVGMRSGLGDHQGVDTLWPLFSPQKGAQEEKPPEDIKRRGSTGAVEEGAQRRSTGCQVIDT